MQISYLQGQKHGLKQVSAQITYINYSQTHHLKKINASILRKYFLIFGWLKIVLWLTEVIKMT